ncbi:hypothetical protein CDD83_6940 [Cordyceps sp. RAO-2017]|nr:hypothetical protein CDD83_6940 [Cordyceps sp. RAO-2017]
MLRSKLLTHQCLDALSYPHGKGITHRDLKPDKIVLKTRNPVLIKIIDFNLSSALEPMRPCVGTLYYVAPEILRGRSSYDNKTDTWFLGSCVMELFVGMPPSKDDLNPCEFQLHVLLKGKRHMYAAHFVRHVLNIDPSERPTAEEALDHLFLPIEEGDADISLPPVDQRDDELPDTAP